MRYFQMDNRQKYNAAIFHFASRSKSSRFAAKSLSPQAINPALTFSQLGCCSKDVHFPARVAAFIGGNRFLADGFSEITHFATTIANTLA
jgi:hypothetical protein